MDIRYIGKNITVTEGMKDHLNDKLQRYEKYAPKLVESHVVLKKQKYLFEAEITLLGKNLRAFGDGRSKDNIFAAIDLAYVRVEKQLKKFREKIKDHHKKNKKSKFQRSAQENYDAQAVSPLEEYRVQGNQPAVLKSERALKKITLEQASRQLEDSSESFLVFRNADNLKTNVLFKREDGNHGLIEVN